MRKTMLLAAPLLLMLQGKAGAADSFQFSPPPFPLLNLRSVDAQTHHSMTYVGMKVGDFNFIAADFGASRMVKYWDRGGASLAGNAQLILGTGEFPIDPALGGGSFDVTMFGPGFNLAPNLNFDLYGDEEDNFSLPFYFGPHVSGSVITGFASFDSVITNVYPAPIGTVTTTFSSFTDLTVSNMFYGWQTGIQAGINLGDSVKFVPYLDIRQDIGGFVSSSISNSYSYSSKRGSSTLASGSGSSSSSTTDSISALPVSTTPGFDIVFRKLGLSLGGAVQALEQAGSSSGDKTKTVIINLRFQKKFRSICGV